MPTTPRQWFEANHRNWDERVALHLNSTDDDLDALREHPKITWHALDGLVLDENGLYGWPDKPWLPLSFSLSAVKD